MPLPKLHIKCRDVYLDGYINCDVDGIIANGTNINSTTINNYFKHPFGSNPKPTYLDVKMDLLKQWPFDDNYATEIVTVGVIEHFNTQDMNFFLSEVERVLRRRGRWVISFMHLYKTIKQYWNSNPELCMRLVYGPNKNPHRWNYNPITFKQLLRDRGWKVRREDIIKCDYPSIGLIAKKLK